MNNPDTTPPRPSTPSPDSYGTQPEDFIQFWADRGVNFKTHLDKGGNLVARLDADTMQQLITYMRGEGYSQEADGLEAALGARSDDQL